MADIWRLITLSAPAHRHAPGGSYNGCKSGGALFGPDMATQIVSKVLLVDDDELVRHNLGTIIAAAGFQVLTAQDGESALVSMQRDFTSIVILDIRMPGMNGLDLCRSIRSRTYAGYVYILLHTGKDADPDVLAGLEAGADDYLSKRTQNSQLLGRLRTAQRILKLEHSLKTALSDQERMAMTDALTGAFNRRYLLQHLDVELGRAHRSSSMLSVLMLDFDHFSEVNDRYGHTAGDAVLLELAGRIQANLRRDSDWCARLGGDEFVVVLPDTDTNGARVIADKLLRAIEKAPMRAGDTPLPMTVSIGVSGLDVFEDRQRHTVNDLLASADACLYRSKEAGRNRASMPDIAGISRRSLRRIECRVPGSG